MRSLLCLAILCSLALAADQPAWLVPFPQARDQVDLGQGTSTYTALGPASDVISHYETNLRNAGINFNAQSDGIGVSIVAAAGNQSAVIRLREQDGVTKVNVSYAVTTAAPPPVAPLPGAPGETISPNRHAPYNWIMQSSAAHGSASPAKPNSVAAAPLTLAAQASIVDVFPEDCGFSLRDQEEHSVAFKNASAAVGKTVAPGTWSLTPIRCAGVSIYLHQ